MYQEFDTKWFHSGNSGPERLTVPHVHTADEGRVQTSDLVFPAGHAAAAPALGTWH